MHEVFLRKWVGKRREKVFSLMLYKIHNNSTTHLQHVEEAFLREWLGENIIHTMGVVSEDFIRL
jgi:hypothetical protein